MSITLQAAARELDIDPKTLSRWIKREQIEVTGDPADRRRRVISWDHFQRLREQRQPSHRIAESAAPPSATEQPAAPSPSLDALRSHLTLLENAHASLSYSVALLIQRTTVLEERYRSLAAKLGGSGVG